MRLGTRIEIRVSKSASVRRADKEQDDGSYSYVYEVDNRFTKDPDFQSGDNACVSRWIVTL